MNTVNYGIMGIPKNERRGAASTALGMVTQRWRSCDMSTIRIPLISRKYPGLFALIDEADYELVTQYEWYANPGANTAYAVSTTRDPVSRKQFIMHRLIVNPPPGRLVDHINHDGLDNRRRNLRLATVAQNQQNHRGLSPTNTSGYVGVSWCKRERKWRAYIESDGRKRSLGYYATKEDAARVRDREAKLLHGEFARLNLPDE